MKFSGYYKNILYSFYFGIFLCFLMISFQVLSFNLTSLTTTSNVGQFDGGGLDSSVTDEVNIYMVDKYNSQYAIGKRARIVGPGTLFTSDIWGGFRVDNGEVGLYQSGSVNGNCETGETVSYYFSGSMVSQNGWVGATILYDTDNYYCVASKKFSFKLDAGPIIGNWVITSNESDSTVVTVKDAYGVRSSISTSEIFNDKLLSINGLVLSDSTSNEFIDSETEFINGESSLLNTQKTDFLGSNVSGHMLNFNKQVDANIIKMTRNLISETNLNLSTLDKDVIYYNLEKQPDLLPSNEENRGPIVNLGNGGNKGNYDFELIEGKKTIIIKGGNILIDTDIVNANNESLLTIVVKRDNDNIKNGGNIYISPKVTNIDAVLVADGSILSYDTINKKVVFADSAHANLLRNQLLIYGAVATKNTLGEDIAIYGTDAYINGAENVEDPSYNLGRLRTFQPILNSEITVDCDDTPGTRIVSMGAESSNTSNQYGFAGKKLCYFDDDPKEKSPGQNFRTTDKLTPVVIEYNSMIQNNPPRILSN